MKSIAIACLFVLAGLAAPTAAADSKLYEIPVPNPGFEEVGEGELPARWQKRGIGVVAEVAVDASEKHSGQRSVRMRATEMARTNVLTEPFPVAAGETIHASAWVKVKDVPPDQGKIMMVGEWTDADGKHEQASRIEVADLAKGDWQQVKGKIAVPQGAALMRIRLGFVYAQGTIWWDDVTVHAERPLVARLGLPTARLSPVSGKVPVVVVNRTQQTGDVRVRVNLADDKPQTVDVKLSGALEQRVDVPLPITKRGKQIPIRVALLPSDGDEPLFTEERKMHVPPPVLLVPPIPTHWAVEDGKPTIDGEVDLAVAADQLNGATLEAKLVDASGTAHATWTSDAGTAPKDFTNTFSLAPPELPVGDYKLVVTLLPAKGKPMVDEQPFGVVRRAHAKSTLNADGFPVHDGKAIFPMGVFNGGARVKELGEAGFTVQHAYNAANVELGERPNDQGAKDFLDNAQKNGLKCLFLIPRGLAFGGDWDGVRRRIRMFRNHPALLAWDQEEGMARGDLTLEQYAKLVRLIRAEDPHHPIMVGDARDVISRVTDRSSFFPVDHMDLGMWWWYPFPLEHGKDSGLEGEERSKELELTPPSFLTQARTDKPLWVGIQAYKKPQDWARYPKPVEYRAQAYLAVIHGAKGLMYYGGSVTGGIYLKPDEANWEYIKKLATELREMAPVFMGKTLDAPRGDPAAPLSLMLKQTPDGRVVMLACNRSAKPLEEVRFVIRGAATGSVKVLFEDRTVVAEGDPVSACVLKDHFEPYQVHVYEFPRR